MLAFYDHGNVTRLILASPTSRLVGYAVSAYVVQTEAGPVLVDTGLPFAWRSLRRYLTARGRRDAREPCVYDRAHVHYPCHGQRQRRRPRARGAHRSCRAYATPPLDAEPAP